VEARVRCVVEKNMGSAHPLVEVNVSFNLKEILPLVKEL